ncbi:MAG: GLUG motif-containing protein [Dehalococcoidia bacterium]
MKRVAVFSVVVALLAVLAGSGCNGLRNGLRPPDPGPSLDLEIRTWYDLYAIRDNLAGHHRLMNSLNATSPGYDELAGSAANDGKGWQPLGYCDYVPPYSCLPFTGSFDGQGYEIGDLFVERPAEAQVGLFGLVGAGGVIDDVRLVNADVTGAYYVGGLVGENGGTVSNSHATGRVTGTRSVGGLVGESEGTLSNSYFSGSVAGTASVGGLVGSNIGGTVSNSYYSYDDVLINGENTITVGALFAEDFEQWLADNKSLDVDERLSQENGYYLIHDVDDFKQLLPFGQDGSLKFRLTDDLDLADEPDFYIPYLAGEFDGNGYKISNLALNLGGVSHVGLFGYLASGGKLTQVGLENANIRGDPYYAGGLVARNRGTVSNSYSSGSVTGGEIVGGLVAVNDGTVRNSSSTGNVSGKYSVGGLVGENWGSLSNSHSTGDVTGDACAGGLVGENRGTVGDSYAAGNVTGLIAGGLVGINWSAVGDSHASGSVTGVAWVGGLVGQTWGGTVRNAYATGSVTGESDVGGLVGLSGSSTVSNSYSTGSVDGEFGVGGLVGRSDVSTVSNCYSTGMVTGDKAVGGLLGYIFMGTLGTSYSVSSVTGEEHVGGLVGRNNDGTVSKSFWDVEMSGQATSHGGTGKTTAEMKDIATFSGAGWNIIAVAPGETNPTYTWNIVDAVIYPFLSWQM